MMRMLRDEKGQSIVLIMLMMVVLLGTVGLAVDVGSALSQRRQMQNAADAAAVAGAREVVLNNSRAVIYNRINEYAVTRNRATGFTATFYPDGQSLTSNPGTPPAGATGVCVVANASANTMFISLFGIRTWNVSARSCAYAPPTSCSQGYAMWANNASCSKTIDWTGGNWGIGGDIHTNNNLVSSTSGTQVNGILEYVTSVSGGFTYNPPPPANPAQVTASGSYPVQYNAANYAPGTPKAVAAGSNYHYYAAATNFSSAASLPDGLYYIDGTGDSHISAPGLTGRKITMVSTGGIVWSASGASVTPYIDALFLMSTRSQNCTSGTFSVNVSGSGSALAGIIFAPSGAVQISGSSNSTLGGSVIANAIKVSGTAGSIDQAAISCGGGVRNIRFVGP